MPIGGRVPSQRHQNVWRSEGACIELWRPRRFVERATQAAACCAWRRLEGHRRHDVLLKHPLALRHALRRESSSGKGGGGGQRSESLRRGAGYRAQKALHFHALHVLARQNM
eukprot:5775978-Pleurochrysis_carterae.AAC.2